MWFFTEVTDVGIFETAAEVGHMVFLSATVEPPKWIQKAVVRPCRIHPEFSPTASTQGPFSS